MLGQDQSVASAPPWVARTARALALAGGLCAGPAGQTDAAALGQINKLTDVSFTALNPMVSASSAQNVCAYSAGLSKQYTITASGSGPGNAFTLSSGSLTLPYGVQWSGSSGSTTGTALSANTPSAVFTSTATVAGCTTGASTSASLIVTLASTDLQSASANVTYSGVLTIVLAAQ